MIGRTSLNFLTAENLLSVASSVIWFAIAGYFLKRFAFTTKKPVTLSLSLMSVSCALVGIVQRQGIQETLLRLLLFGTALFVGTSILRAHFTEKR